MRRDTGSRKVRVNSNYIFVPVPMDEINPAIPGALSEGDLVKVVNLRGCPPANTIGFCYVNKNGKFSGMVCTNSLIPIKVWERMNKKK